MLAYARRVGNNSKNDEKKNINKNKITYTFPSSSSSYHLLIMINFLKNYKMMRDFLFIDCFYHSYFLFQSLLLTVALSDFYLLFTTMQIILKWYIL